MKTPKLNNSGSGLVTVLVCVMFLVALGVSLLFVSYTGVAVRAVEQASERSFYDAESAMDAVRLEVQDCVADALGNAWQDTLTRYSSIVAEKSQDDAANALQTQFISSFKTHLREGDLFKDTPVDHLSTVLTGGTAKLTGGSNVAWSDKNPVVVLQGLTLTYEDGGYKDVIITDIAIKAPPFSYEPTPSVAGVSPIALIAEGELNVSGNDVKITGDAYANSISVNFGNNLSYDNGKLVTSGAVNIYNNSTLSGGTDSELWCGAINLGASANLTTNGSADVYCSGDLAFNGNNASATLSGTYTGFGYTNNLSANNVATNNSSIIINGRNSTLDMDGLVSLILAGSAYISKEGDNTDVLMGQSIATLSDQLVYLVPVDYLEGVLDSNPCILSGGMTSLTGDQLTAIGTALKTALPTYNIVGVQPVYSHGSSQTMVYLFIRFNSRTDANNYFKSIYQQYNDYAELYLSECIKAQNTIAAGNTYIRNEGANVFIDPSNNTTGIEGLRAQCSALSRSWQNLCRTLTETTTSAGIYNYYVNSTMVRGLPEGRPLLFKKDGNAIGCVTSGNCIVPDCFGDGSPSTVGRILICDGDVTVNGAFKGLIIANGTVTLNAGVAASDDASLALLAKTDAGDALISYLNGGDAALPGGGDETDNGVNWDMSELVSYVNWKKS